MMEKVNLSLGYQISMKGKICWYTKFTNVFTTGEYRRTGEEKYLLNLNLFQIKISFVKKQTSRPHCLYCISMYCTVECKKGHFHRIFLL